MRVRGKAQPPLALPFTKDRESMKTIKLNKDRRGVGTITLNRPKVHNAFDRQLVAELHEALNQWGADDSIRVVIITGSGESFSAGADLAWMRAMAEASGEENQQDAMALATMLRALNYLSKPTIAQVNGAAFGGGVGLIACCDIAVASDEAVFSFSEARLGLAPAVISPYVFRRIGERHARRYFQTAERFDAGRARDLDLVHEVVPSDQVAGVVKGLVNQILKNGPAAVAVCKNLVFAIAGHDAQRQQKLDEYTAELIARLRVGAEGQEGLTAFLEKRKPEWL